MIRSEIAIVRDRDRLGIAIVRDRDPLRDRDFPVKSEGLASHPSQTVSANHSILDPTV